MVEGCARPGKAATIPCGHSYSVPGLPSLKPRRWPEWCMCSRQRGERPLRMPQERRPAGRAPLSMGDFLRGADGLAGFPGAGVAQSAPLHEPKGRQAPSFGGMDTLSDLPLDSDDVRMLDPQPILDAVAVLDSLGTDLSGASMRFLAWLCVGDGVNCWIEAQYGVKSYGGAITDALNSVGQANHRDLCRDADTLHASTVLLLQRFLKKAIDHQADRLAH